MFISIEGKVIIQCSINNYSKQDCEKEEKKYEIIMTNTEGSQVVDTIHPPPDDKKQFLVLSTCFEYASIN